MHKQYVTIKEITDSFTITIIRTPGNQKQLHHKQQLFQLLEYTESKNPERKEKKKI
jgi:hypothetical protein